jgi:hypothetical protein
VNLEREEHAQMLLSQCNSFYKKERKRNLLIFLLFIDYEKAYDNLNRNLLYKILQDDKIPPQLIKAIKSKNKKQKFP